MLEVDPFAREVIMTRPGFLEMVIRADSYEILNAYVRMYPEEDLKRSHAEAAIEGNHMDSFRWFLETQEYEVGKLQSLCRVALLRARYAAVDMIVAACPPKYPRTMVIPDNVDVTIETSIRILGRYKILVSGPRTKAEAILALDLDIMMRITPPNERDLFMVRALSLGRTDLAEKLFILDGRVSQKWDLTYLDRNILSPDTREYMMTRFHQFGPCVIPDPAPSDSQIVRDPRLQS